MNDEEESKLQQQSLWNPQQHLEHVGGDSSRDPGGGGEELHDGKLPYLW